MAEIETSLLAKVHASEGAYSQPVLIGFLRSRKKYIGTLVEAVNGQSLKDLKRAIKKKGGKKLKVYPEINTIFAEMPVDKVTELTSISCAQKVYEAEGDIKPCLNQSVPLIMGAEKWQIPYRIKGQKLEGQGIKVAVIDGGIDKKHPDFGWWRIKRIKNFSGGRKYHGTEHGTHVAGIIAGSGKASGYRFSGVAPKVKLYIAKVFINNETTRDIILDAIRWAIKKKVHVINMSLGERHACSDGSCSLCQMTDYAVSRGITVVVAAGNSGPWEGTIECPGNAKLAITVGAATKAQPLLIAGFSSRGSVKNSAGKPDLVAPGIGIIAPQPKKQYEMMKGTSMAAPHVTGLVALLYQAKKNLPGKKKLTPAEIKLALKQGCVDLKAHHTAQGCGLVNLKRSLAIIQPTPRPSWFSKRRKKIPLVAGALAQTEIIAPQPATCPASLPMFCPHYDENVCNTRYETCVHYQAATQVNVLKKVKEMEPT